MADLRTWLPHANFAVTAMVLHERELRESLRGARQVQDAMQGRMVGAEQHPNVLAWDGCILAVMMYGDCMVRELHRRGLRTSEHCVITAGPEVFPWAPPGYRVPEWLGDFRTHSDHRKHLMEFKRDGWYDQWGWGDR